MKEDFKTIVGKRIKSAREQLGLSQFELAEKICITSASISGYEKGNNLPSLTVVFELSKVLNVSIDWLCGLTETKAPVGSKIPSNYTEIISDLFKNDSGKLNFSIARMEMGGQRNPIIYFKDVVMEEFLKEWGKMKAVYENNMIDKDVYKLWQEKTLNKYNFSIANYYKHLADGSLQDPCDTLAVIDDNGCIIDEIIWDFTRDDEI